jgi:hypothetical protein
MDRVTFVVLLVTGTFVSDWLNRRIWRYLARLT